MYTERLRIIHFDVSQGESSLISLLTPKKDFHVLIDGGRKCRGKYVARCIEDLDIDTLNAVICTHFDNDHHEGLVPVIESPDIQVEELLVPEFGHNIDKFDGLKRACKRKGVPWSVAKEGHDLFDSDACELKIIHVGTPELRDDNTASIACLLKMNSFTYYTGGDLPWDMEERLPLPKHVCAFKVGHHGAETSTSETFVKRLNASAAFISAGRHAHGHPRQEILDYLRNSATMQRIYSTNCIHPRLGFHDENTPNDPHAKGLVCSNRTNGVLGHIVVYTDDELSQQHTDSKPGFYVLRPPPEGDGGSWQAYKHACSDRKHLARQSVPGGIGRMSDSEYPEYRLAELSPSVREIRRDVGNSFTFQGSILALTEDERRTELRPSSPIHQYIDDPPNFSVVEGTPSTTGAKANRKRKAEYHHPDEKKRTSTCVGCGDRPTGRPRGEELVECTHGDAWFVCEDCDEEFSDGFDCGV